MVSRVLGGNHEFEADRLANSPVRVHGKGRGYEKKAIRWLMVAQKRGYDALIPLVDRDENMDRESELKIAQQYPTAIGDKHLPRAMGVAVEMYDAWIFADEQALSRVVGAIIQTQQAPEAIAKPKEHLRMLLQREASRPPYAKLYSDVAGEIDLERLRLRCPAGFGTFAQRIEEMRLPGDCPTGGTPV